MADNTDSGFYSCRTCNPRRIMDKSTQKRKKAEKGRSRIWNTRVDTRYYPSYLTCSRNRSDHLQPDIPFLLQVRISLQLYPKRIHRHRNAKGLQPEKRRQHSRSHRGWSSRRAVKRKAKRNIAKRYLRSA